MAAPKPAKPDMPDATTIDAARAAGESVGQGVGEASTRVDDRVPDAVTEAGRAQALSLAMLDAAAHLRRLETLSLAAIAAGLEKILAGEAEAGAAALEATEAGLDKAIDRLARLVTLAGAAE